MPAHPVIVQIGTALFTCSAVVPATIAVQNHRAAVVHHAKPHRAHHARAPRTPRAAPVCPPSGITTLGKALPTADPLAMMNDDVEESRPAGRSYSTPPPAFVTRSGYEATRPEPFAPYIPQPGTPGGWAEPLPTPAPTTEPTPTPVESLPEPRTWAMMLAGFALIGAAIRRRAQRACTVPAM